MTSTERRQATGRTPSMLASLLVLGVIIDLDNTGLQLGQGTGQFGHPLRSLLI